LGIARARDELSRLAPVDLATELLARLGGGESFDGSDELLIAERLAQSLGSSIDVHLNRFARRRHRDLLSPVVDRLGLHTLRGATVVDVGCGSLNPFSFSYLLLLLGAEKAYAIDAEPIQDVVLATKALATATAWLLLDPSEVLGVDAIGRAEVLRNARDFDLHLLAAGDPAGIAGSRLAHRIESIHRLSLETGEADAVFSVSLLEHLDRIDEALESLRRVTKPGGVGLHVVDFVDHRSYGDARVSPYAFLTETPGPALLHGCNRIRCREMCQLFERHGFAVEHVERWSQHPPPTEAERARFAEPYRSMSYENIATDGARILVRRRGQFN
jgi:SAM-dependent methyltransferase